MLSIPINVYTPQKNLEVYTVTAKQTYSFLCKSENGWINDEMRSISFSTPLV